MSNEICNLPKITDIKDMLNKTKNLYENKPAYKFRTQTPGVFKTISHGEVREMVDCLGTSLINLNLKGKRIAVIGENRYEWEISYLSVVCGTGIIVPLDKSLPENELISLVGRSDVEAIFYSQKYEETLKRIAKSGHIKLKHLISMDLEKNTNGIFSWKELIEKGRELIKAGDRRFLDAKINPDEMSIMLYTSGTTSAAKAVMLSHRNLCSNIMDVASVLGLSSDDTRLSFLPVHHVFECTVGFLLSLYTGMEVAFCDGIRHIVSNMKEYGITFMTCVPALYENIYKNIVRNIEKQGKLEKIKKQIEETKDFSMEKKKEVFKEIHNIFGGKVRLLISGAASLDPVIEKGYRDFGINLVQGYGLTETSPVVCVGTNNNYRLGSIGKALPNTKVDVYDLNEEGIGELIVKGPNVMLGYYGNDEATQEVMDDGWFHTGDLCRIDEDGYVFILGRKKSVIVLKNGKNIFPEEMENLVNKIEGVKESMIFGKQNGNSENDIKIHIEIVYDPEIIKDMYKTEDEEEIFKIISSKIKEINKTMPAYKAIRGIILTKEPLIKTTTSKIKRTEELKKINKKYLEK